MIEGKKVVVVMPAYNAEKTLKATWEAIPKPLVDEVILTDDASQDNTIHLARELGIHQVLLHNQNLGYGGNQKTCYRAALESGADYVVMLHPDYQYAPELISPMVHLLHSGLYGVVFGSRILGTGALKGGMPFYKYVANRGLSFFQNLMMGLKLSEYHTGYRAYSREVLEKIPFEKNSNDFVFDNQMILQIAWAGYEIAEITCPTRYFAEASSINFKRSLRYGLGVSWFALAYRLHKWKWIRLKILTT